VNNYVKNDVKTGVGKRGDPIRMPEAPGSRDLRLAD
jgi:hypothetical protein